MYLIYCKTIYKKFILEKIFTLSSSISWFVRTPYFGISDPTNNVSSVTSLFDPTIFPINNELPVVIPVEDSWYERLLDVAIFFAIACSLLVPIRVDGGVDRLIWVDILPPLSRLSSAIVIKLREKNEIVSFYFKNRLQKDLTIDIYVHYILFLFDYSIWYNTVSLSIM